MHVHEYAFTPCTTGQVHISHDAYGYVAIVAMSTNVYLRMYNTLLID